MQQAIVKHAANVLTKTQQNQRKHLESLIERSLRYHLEAAAALLKIRDERLYRDTHDTFEAYCGERWGISRAQGNRLCDWAEVSDNLSPIGDKLPVHESHARPLARLTPDQQRGAWRIIHDRNPNGFDADDVEVVAREVRSTPVSNGRHGKTSTPVIVAEDHTPLRSPISWYGGKGTLAEKIVSLLPPHKTYVEPFFGGGSVLFAKPPSAIEIINDIHHGVTDFFKVLRNPKDAKKLQDVLRMTPYSREEHRRCVEEPRTSDRVEDARRFFVSVRQSYGGIENDSWSMAAVPKGGQRAATFADIVDELLLYTERLRRVQVDNRDALALLAICDVPETVIYCDPPYPSSHRTADNRGYRHEMDDKDHRTLLAKLVSMKHANVVLSGYRCPLYDRALRDWRRYEWKMTMNSAKPGDNGVKSERIEVVWLNF